MPSGTGATRLILPFLQAQLLEKPSVIAALALGPSHAKMNLCFARMAKLARESRMAERPFAWLMTCIMWAGPVWGFSTAPQVNCPTQFRAVASEVSAPQEGEHALSKAQIKFQVFDAIKGASADDSLSVEILKFGPLKVEQGKEYLVQLDKGKLCWIEEI